MGNLINKLLYQPPLDLDPGVSQITYLVTKSEKRTFCHFINNNAKYTILFSHGNAETLFRSKIWFEREFLPRIKGNIFNVLIYEYTGYTYTNPEYYFSNSAPREKYIYEDIDAAFEYLINIKEIKPKNIILYGRSLGTGPTIDLASRVKVGGVILQSAFLSAFKVALNLRFDICGDQFLNYKKIDKIECPVLLIHGVDDEIVPFEHSVQLHELCKNKYQPLWVRGAGHNDLKGFGRLFYDSIEKFIESIELNYVSQKIGNANLSLLNS